MITSKRNQPRKFLKNHLRCLYGGRNDAHFFTNGLKMTWSSLHMSINSLRKKARRIPSFSFTIDMGIILWQTVGHSNLIARFKIELYYSL